MFTLERGVLMKSLLAKIMLLIFLASLLLSFAACGKDKTDTTTGIPTTEQATTVPATDPPETGPVPVETLRLALVSAGAAEWDGVYASLTNEQKTAIMDYFNSAGKLVEFREDNVYYVDNNGETTTDANATTVPGASTTKAAAGVTKPAGAAVTGITINPANLNLNVGGSQALTAAVTPANAKNKTVTWTTDNDKVVSVNASGMVVAKSVGTAKITATANGGTGFSAACTVKVTSAPTGAVVSYLYNEDEGFFYIENDPWQRNFGFNRLYDWGAPITQMFYNTVRAKFNYGGKDWMIQMWKGQYGYAFVGSEIGVYTKPVKQAVEHYDCASNDDSLMMQMTLYKKDKWLFTRTYDKYWWITGFVPGVLDKFADRSELTMLGLITLKDAAMKDAFVAALQSNGFTAGYNGFSTPDTYSVEGNSVYINWKSIGQTAIKPATTVPATTVPVTETTAPETTQAAT